MSSLRIPIVSTAIVALALAISACGGSEGGAQQVLDEATLEGVESGKLNLFGELAQGTAGVHLWFALSGKFQSQKGADLPELDLTATVEKGRGETGKKTDFEGGLTLLGDGEAYVAFDGTKYKVDPTTYGYVRSTLGESEEVSACQEVVSDRKLSEFIEDPTEEDSVSGDGESVTKVSGNIDGEAAIDALDEMRQDALCNEQLEAAPGVQPLLSELDESEGQVENPVEDAHVEVYVGSDHIVRRVILQAPTIKPPAGVGGEGSPDSVGLEFDFTLTGVNEPQKITAPKGAKPLSALFVKLGVNPIELLGVLQGGIGGAGLTNFLERLANAGSAK